MESAANDHAIPAPDPAARLLDEPVRLVEYDPAWADAYERQAGRMRVALPGRLLEVRHVGSTAVPGLCAKPIVDMIAGLADFADVESATATLRRLGWTYLPDAPAQGGDRRWLLLHDGRTRTHHVHLVAHGSRAWRERVAFCELLKSDAAVRAEYDALKRALAARFADRREAYTAAKEPFIMRAVLRVLGAA
jgi:GrpB-like predicted nucleotidyltransferase (UPF0157 family)